MSSSEKLHYIKELLQSCLVPTLKHDIGSVQIQTEHFDEYRKAVELQLPLLYDLLQQRGKTISTDSEQNTSEVNAFIIILLCEITAPGTPYRLTHESIQKGANFFLERQQPFGGLVEQHVFTYYQEKLHSSSWKRQIGPVHGFLRFLEVKYNSTSNKGIAMTKEWLHFCLSVGLTVHECHEPMYKEIAISIFEVLLNHSKFADVQEQNIHSVIYEAIFNDVHLMGCESSTVRVWNCLLKCLDFFNDISSFDWCQIDDLMDILLRNITLTSNILTSASLLEFVTKFGAFFAINRQEILSKCDSNLNDSTALREFRDICAQNTSYTIFRWAKSILNMFNANAYKLLQDSPSHQFLKKLQRCYTVCIIPINLQVIEPHLLPFFDKFTAVLMEVIVQKHNPTTIRLIKCMLETFHIQLDQDPCCNSNANFTKYYEAFKKLLQHDIFIK